jgi:hypothetical protein
MMYPMKTVIAQRVRHAGYTQYLMECGHAGTIEARDKVLPAMPCYSCVPEGMTMVAGGKPARRYNANWELIEG